MKAWWGVVFSVLASLLCPVPGPIAAQLPLVNGGFEIDTNEDGIPNGWVRLVTSYLRHEDLGPPVTRSGSAAMELHRLSLAQGIPFLPDRYYAVRSYVRGDEGGERAQVAIRFNLSDDSSKRTTSGRTVTALEYLPISVCGRSPADATKAFVEIGSGKMDWIWHDDVSFFSEEIANPSFEEDEDIDGVPDGWLWVGGPVASPVGIGGSTAVLVNSEQVVSQEAAVCTDYDYLWTFRLRGDTGGENALISVEWFGPEGESVRVDTLSPTLGTEWGLYSMQARAARNYWSTRPAMLLVATVGTGSTSEYVWIDHVYVDRLVLESELVSPNGDGIHDAVEMRLRIDEDAYAEIDLKDSGGGTVQVLETGQWFSADVHTFTWEPSPVLPDATYELELRLWDSLGYSRTLTRPVVIDTRWLYEAPPPLEQDQFIRGVYAGGTPFNIEADQFNTGLVESAAVLGANTILVGVLTSVRPAVLEAAEQAGIGVGLYMQIAYSWLSKSMSERGVDEAEFRRRFGPTIEGLRDFSSLFAYYTFDEPRLEIAQRVFLMNQIFRELDPSRPSLNTINQKGTEAGVLDVVRPPLYLYDRYSFAPDAAIGDLGDFIVKIEEAGQRAETRGISLWIAPQAFLTPNGARFPTSAETFCMAYLCLANGADGLVYFFFGATRQSSADPTSKFLFGIIDVDFSPSPIYEDIESVFDLLREKGDLFLDLRMAPGVGSTISPGYCTTQEDSLGNVYVWLINTDCLVPRTVAADLTDSYSTGHDVLSNRPLVWGNGGQLVETTLPPGGAALIRLDEPPPSPPTTPTDLVEAFGAAGTFAFDLGPIPGDGPADEYVFMDYQEGLLYLHTRTNRLEIWDLLSLEPRLLSRIPAGRAGSRVRVHGGLLTLCSWVTGLVLVDVSDPENPLVLSTFMGYNGNAENCEIVGDTLFVTAKNYGIYILDASDPTDLQIVNRFLTPGLALDLRVRDGIAYIADGIAGLTIVDVSDPLNPAILSNLRIPGDDARQIILRGEICYVIGKPTVVAAVDVSDPEYPLLIHTEHTFHMEKASLGSTTMVVADRVGGLAFLYVSMPGYPVLWGRARTDGYPVDVICADNRLFTIDHESRFHYYYFEEPFVTGVGGRDWTTYR